MSLAHTVALVTGASSGLGAATARHLLQKGARVLLADLNDAIPTGSSSSSSANNAIFCPTDVTDSDSVQRALDMAEASFGEPINAAINCAGIAKAKKTLSKQGPHPLQDFDTTLRVNLLGSFNVSRLAAGRMSQRTQLDEHGLRGCIIHTASIAAYEGQIGQVAYAASKGGIVGMTLPMARELASYGIRVMTIVRDVQDEYAVTEGVERLCARFE
jgi:3-hydroxyacyl-CoA dehydrogenase/3-hydroxy-2-methylbutyryl-CoA dehydrogenase